MKLSLRNVGKIYNESQIEINGITVIAGENGTGKSTIGKVLYSIFTSLHNIKDKVYESRISSVTIRLRNIRKNLGRDYQRNDYKIAKQIVDHYKKGFDLESVEQLMITHLDYYNEIEESEKKVLVSDIKKIMEMSEDDIVTRIVEMTFTTKFAGQLQHVNHLDEPALVKLYIHGTEITVEDNYQKDLIVKDYLPLMKNIIYIDDEFTLENNIVLYNNSNFSQELPYSKVVLRKNAIDDVVGQMLSEDRYKNIINRMNQANIGELISENGIDFEYKESGLSKSISVENVSSGTKIMVLLKQIIQNGYLEDNGIIVLDEPEIHLHPEWQKMLAEIIVIIQVEFNVNFLISTHSSDFLTFIQYYSKKYHIDSKNKAYLLKDSNEFTSKIHDVTDNVDEIYRVLGESFIRVSGELKYES